MNLSGSNEQMLPQPQSVEQEDEEIIWGHNFLVPVLMLFVLGFFAILGYYILDQMFIQWATTPFWDASMASAADSFLTAQRGFDYLMVIIMVGALVALGVTSYRIFTAPIFFFVTLFMGAFFGFVAYFFSYVFQTYAAQPIFATVIAYFPRTIMICTNLHWVGLAALVIGSITLYAKRPKDAGYVE